MRQYRLITPTSSITNFNSKLITDPKKSKNSTSTNSNTDAIKRKSNTESANASPTIGKIRNLRSRTTTNSVSPEQAAVVVKDYILPLFRIERNLKNIRKRNETFSSKTTDLKDVGMISDFKLVEDLYNKLELLKKQLESKEKELKIAVQDRELYEQDFKTLNEQHLNSESNIAFVNFSKTQVLKKMHQDEFSSYMIKEQCSKYKILYEDEIENSQELSKLLDEEKAKSDKLRNIAVKLEYVNALLVMENDLLGEKLKGLIFSLQNIIGSLNSELKMQQEFQVVSQMVKVLSEEALTEYEIFEEMESEKQEMEVLVKELSDITMGIQGKKDKFIRILRDKNSRIEAELKQARFARDKFQSDCEEVSKKFLDLQDQNNKLKVKLKKMKKVSADDFFEEKYCKNCKNAYVEASNYNWSCKRHANDYTENVYWCCGQHEKNAPGCISSKHTPSEEHVKEELIDIMNTVFCSSCKTPGHTHMECPKDPNTRSNFDPNEELTRIQEKKKKKVPNSESYAVKKKFLKMVIRRIKQYENAEEPSSAVTEKKHKEWFSDIQQYKEQFVCHNCTIRDLLRSVSKLNN